MGEFEDVLAWLRGLAWPCAPPIGVGEFEVLYASAAEIVVWYSPAREGHRMGEVAIPCARLAAAWERLAAGGTLDEASLAELGAGLAGGRWLLAVLAQLPGARVDPEPLALTWAPESEPVSAPKIVRRKRIAEPKPAATPGRPRGRPRQLAASVEGAVRRTHRSSKVPVRAVEAREQR
jgi:hypothetical protein